MRDDQINDLMQILCHYGREPQKAKLCEELRELIDATTEDMHYQLPQTREHFLEELADVTIMVTQMQLGLTIKEQAEFWKWVDFKINRTLRRIEDE